MKNLKHLWYCTGSCREGGTAFRTGEDMVDYFARLKLNADCHGTIIRGLVLRSDSYHVLLEESPGSNPGLLAGKVAAAYNDSFNQRKKQKGQLFNRDQAAYRVRSQATLKKLEKNIFNFTSGSIAYLYYNLEDIGWMLQQMLHAEMKWMSANRSA